MNLLEHSISSATNRVDKNTKELVFSQPDLDPGTGDTVARSWTVTFNATFGRPTPKDDDVFVGLLKTSMDQGLMNEGYAEGPVVPFTRYKLCQTLNWQPSGRNYRAIDDALDRLCGVYIKADNFWYDNDTKLWTDRKFHIIEEAHLYQGEKFQKARKSLGKNPQSTFTWSQVMMESFAAGFVRELDLGVYLGIKNPVSRKLYRYLGKHFYHRSKVSFDIQELGVEKLGYKKTDNYRLQERIAPAINELEEQGIYGLRHEFQSSYGKCQVVFWSGKRSKKSSSSSSTEHPLVARLVSIGVSKADAWAAVKKHKEERLVEDIEHVDFLDEKKEIERSKAGLLATMLKADDAWPRPKGFKTKAEREAIRQKTKQTQAKKEERELAAEKKRRDEEAEALRQVTEYIKEKGLCPNEFLEAALSDSSMCRGRYQSAKAKGDKDTMNLYAETALKSYWRKLSQKEAA